jgi:hypothetical protein
MHCKPLTTIAPAFVLLGLACNQAFAETPNAPTVLLAQKGARS